jgi:hypothetical protein
MWSDGLLFGVAVAAGAIAAVSGFGIGSLLTGPRSDGRDRSGRRSRFCAPPDRYSFSTLAAREVAGLPRVVELRPPARCGASASPAPSVGSRGRCYSDGRATLGCRFASARSCSLPAPVSCLAGRSACASKDGLRGSLASSPVCSAASSEIKEAFDLLRCSGSTWTDRSSWRRRPRSA